MNAKCEQEGLTGMPIGIGSMPQTDANSAVNMVLKYLPNTPFLPELPRRSYLEHIGNSQSEGMPGARVDVTSERLVVETTADLGDAVERFYEAYLAEDVDYFSISSSAAAGFHAMLQKVAASSGRHSCLKGQLTGPTTLGLIAKDENGRALLYNDTFMDILVKATAMKAKWLQGQITAAGAGAIIFFDEPMLQSVGSPTVPIDRYKAVRYLNEVVSAVRCVTGCHCCGNTDWSILMESDVDIIAFDAYHFGEAMALYPSALADFLGRGGMLAWGIVPSTPEVGDVSADDLFARLVKAMNLVCAQGIDSDQLRAQSLLTTSCGLGSLSEELAETALRTLADVSGLFRGSL